MMLVLTRKVGESIMVGDDVKIVVVDIDRGQIKLGIEAPKSTAVHRQEIFNQVVKSRKNLR